jgi:lipoprotein-releasing system ATP-binding protein
MSEQILSATQLYKSYHDGSNVVDVLKGIDLEVKKGETVAIIGPSGSGKSTLLHLLGGLDTPTTGKTCLNQTEWRLLSERKRCQLRNTHLGFVYQFHHLLPEFSALENVMIPLVLSGKPVAVCQEKAVEILDFVGLSERLSHKPAQLSGGERQRVAIARALVHKPGCVLADEPTGNLDQTTATKVLDLMLGLNDKLQTSLVIVTHDLQLAARMDRVLHLQNGVLGG